jgi:RNA polymerase sigma-70 factor (ECF subfamily)
VSESLIPPSELHAAITAIHRAESRRVLATLIRLLGDFDLAEDALQEAFAAALTHWPREGVPRNPRAWLVSTGRFKAIDTLRRRARHGASVAHLVTQLETSADAPSAGEDWPDDRLRLIFTCCHPALAPEAQVALTLREVCGLTTEEIAKAFLAGAPTIAQRIVRAKAKIRDARIPYEVPARDMLSERLEPVLRVVYLVFNEGYSASSGATLTRADLSAEAIRLGRLLAELLPDAETFGLLALMLFQESRRTARTASDGSLMLLANQDRALWDRSLIAEAEQAVARAFATGGVGMYALQAAIAGEHARAAEAAATDWARIVGFYDLLLQAAPSPVIELNRAVAVAMRDGPAAGLDLVDALLARGELADYQFAHSTRADLCRQLGRTVEARAAYERALALSQQEPERRFLEERLSALE